MNTECKNSRRPSDLRAQEKIFGLDFVEPGEDPRKLRAHFFGRMPAGLSDRNVRIDGGRRVRDIRVVSIELMPSSDPEKDDAMEIAVNREGDFSLYTLCLIDAEHHEQRRPFPGMDKRYWCAEFRFRPDAPANVDCAPTCECAPASSPGPDINYLARDYSSFRTLILDRLSLLMPGWNETHAADAQVMLAEVLAYTADYISYYQDAIATEAYLTTARRRISVRRHARLVDYHMHEGCNARAWLFLEAQNCTFAGRNVFFITRGLQNSRELPAVLTEAELAAQVIADSYETFEPVEQSDITLYASHNRIEIYTWGDSECCLPKGATSATLVGRLASTGPGQIAANDLHLSEGDILLFEERVGRDTGLEADADSTHRQAVRLTRVTRNSDPLYDNIDLVDVEWHADDALSFALCLSTVGPAPDCRAISSVGIARGNIIVVDHGRRQDPEDLGTVGSIKVAQACDADCPGDWTTSSPSFQAELKHGPLTFSQPTDTRISASRQLYQDPRRALPDLSVISLSGVANDQRKILWEARFDLLESRPTDRHFVVEIDNEERAHLRFGDGELGRKPTAGATFSAEWYRVGIGVVGNVGAESIVHLVVRPGAMQPPIQSLWNPLPAVGGVDPESIENVKLLAPTAFHNQLKRAITAEDYQALAMQHPGVQRAAARLRWTGGWYEVRVAIDALGTEEPTPEFLDDVRDSLHPYRRLGHDLVVVAATYVPIFVSVFVQARPDYLKAHVKTAVLQALGSGTLADGSRGFFHPDNLTFGQSIHVSQLVTAAQKVAGVDHVRVSELRRLTDPVPDELTHQILKIGELEIAQMGNDADFPDRGRLNVRVGGGR